MAITGRGPELAAASGPRPGCGPGGQDLAGPVAMLGLQPLLDACTGSPDVRIGLVDGPVQAGHPDLAGARLRALPSGRPVGCLATAGEACIHGTFVAGILSARRGSGAPGLCPGCQLLVRPIFTEPGRAGGQIPHTSAEELAHAIAECIDAGAWIINVSASLSRVQAGSARAVEQVLDRAARQGVLVVAAAGNQATVGSTVLTRHPWTVPVVGYDRQARPMNQSNLAGSIGRRGLGAPGERITSLSPAGGTHALSGTSAAAPFVTGTVALLWSLFPDATAVEIKSATAGGPGTRRATVVPPLLDAGQAYRSMSRRSAHAHR